MIGSPNPRKQRHEVAGAGLAAELAAESPADLAAEKRLVCAGGTGIADDGALCDPAGEETRRRPTEKGAAGDAARGRPAAGCGPRSSPRSCSCRRPWRIGRPDIGRRVHRAGRGGGHGSRSRLRHGAQISLPFGRFFISQRGG